MYSHSLRVVLLVLFVSITGAGLWAQDDGGVFVEFGPRIIGADVRVGYRAPLLQNRLTSVSALVGGAWGGEAYYRLPDDSRYSGGPEADDATFNRVNANWDLGVEQDLAARSNLVVAPFLFYRGTWNRNLDDEAENELILLSPRSDSQGILINSFLVGGFVDAVETRDAYATKSGVYAEASAELAPAWFANEVIGASDNVRYNLTVKGFLPLAEVDTDQAPSLGAYLAGFAAADATFGAMGYIPHITRSTIGGRNPRKGLGGAVRGVDSQRFDATVKLIGNVEARIALVDVLAPFVVPGLVVYLDGGYYLDTEELSSTAGENEGFAFTTGAGVSTDLLGIATLVFYTQYYLGGRTVARDAAWTPFALGFGLHF